jgi:hypothetical protein
MRTILVGTAGTCAVAVAAILTGCSGNNAPGHPAADSCTAWKQGTGGKDLAAVQADLAQTVTPGGGVWQSEGTTLRKDATAAAAKPPPVSAGSYRAAMSDYATAGTDQAAGNVGGANAARQRGNTQMAAVKAHQGGCA